jgi:hypothetical protein
MERLEKFDNFLNEETNEDLVAVGFGAPNMAASWNMNGAMRSKATGYSFTPIAGKVRDLAQGIAQQGQNYESNNNTDHSGTGYIKEAKDHIGDAIDDTYNKMTAQSENKVNEEYIETLDGKKDITNALEEISLAWLDWKTGPATEPSDIRPAAKELKAYINDWLNKNIK